MKRYTKTFREFINESGASISSMIPHGNLKVHIRDLMDASPNRGILDGLYEAVNYTPSERYVEIDFDSTGTPSSHLTADDGALMQFMSTVPSKLYPPVTGAFTLIIYDFE